MRKTIGIVSEGPRDSDLLAAVIDSIFPDDEITYRYIQPDESLESPHANGWKGVWRWCDENGKDIDKYSKGVFPQLDLLIVHMDGDVSRTEKASHCLCEGVECPHKDETIPPNCRYPKECPITLPCNNHGEPPEGYVSHLRELLSRMFSEEHEIPIIFVIPCDSTDIWIVAALDDMEDYELLKNPWSTVISKGKYYHSVRIHGDKKNKSAYLNLIEQMLKQWDRVINRCKQAEQFQRELVEMIALHTCESTNAE